MKKLLALTLTLASVGLAGVSAEAKTAGSANSVAAVNVSKAAPAAVQWRNRRNRRPTIRNYSRLVRRGRTVWRETYQVRYLPNGRTVTRLVSRVRVR